MLEMYMPRLEGGVKSFTSSKNNINLKYISGCKSHPKNQLYKIESDLKFTPYNTSHISIKKKTQQLYKINTLC